MVPYSGGDGMRSRSGRAGTRGVASGGNSGVMSSSLAGGTGVVTPELPEVEGLLEVVALLAETCSPENVVNMNTCAAAFVASHAMAFVTTKGFHFALTESSIIDIRRSGLL